MKDIQELSEPSLQPFYKPKIIPKEFTLKRKTSIVYKTPAERLFSATSGEWASLQEPVIENTTLHQTIQLREVGLPQTRLVNYKPVTE